LTPQKHCKSTHNPLITYICDKFETTGNYQYVARFVYNRKGTDFASSWCQENGARFLTTLDRAALAEIVETMSQCAGMLFSIHAIYVVFM